MENGQLNNRELFNDRLKLYRHKYGLGPEDGDEQEIDMDSKPVEK